MTLPRTTADIAFRSHERFLWGLCYRMTGSAADADDIVQETFVRALACPPPDTAAPLRPWLVRVAMNLARDHLRQRRRRRYHGPWLPTPIEDDSGDLELPPAHEPSHTASRYDLLESVTVAFLVALEALSPPRRAVLLLRDVFDYSVSETADALGLSEANVKTTHHRARRQMDAYDKRRCRPSADLTARTRQALERFLVALRTQDLTAVEAALATDATALSDGGGEFTSAGTPILGASRVARAYAKLAAHRTPDANRIAIRLVNRLPALISEDDAPPDRWAPRWLLQVEIDDHDHIRAIHTILATAKVSRLRPVARD